VKKRRRKELEEGIYDIMMKHEKSASHGYIKSRWVVKADSEKSGATAR
jgi:hypothetical protein